MKIDIAFYNATDVARLLGDDRPDWQAFEVLAAEERGELHRVRTEVADEGDSRLFAVGRHWWEAVEKGGEVAFIDEDSASFTDVADRLYSPIVDEATDEGCAIYAQNRYGIIRFATAKQSHAEAFKAELTSGDFGETARTFARLLSLNGISPMCVPWGKENALTLAGGVKVWAN